MNRRVKTPKAAEYLGVAEITLKNSRITGRLNHLSAPPYYKIGKNVGYDLDELDEYIRQCRVVPTPEAAAA